MSSCLNSLWKSLDKSLKVCETPQKFSGDPPRVCMAVQLRVPGRVSALVPAATRCPVLTQYVLCARSAVLLRKEYHNVRGYLADPISRAEQDKAVRYRAEGGAEMRPLGKKWESGKRDF
eukprot:3235018-Rhodomonas_salina.1